MASENPKDELQMELLEECHVLATDEHEEPRALEGDCWPDKDDNIDDDRDDDISDGVRSKFSKKVDLFFSSDGKTLPRVSMLSNIAYTIPAHIIMIIANLIVSKIFEDTDYDSNLHTFRIKLWTRLSVIAGIYILFSIYLLGAKKIPSGMLLAVGGVHAFLMNRDIGKFWPAWIVASLWSFGAGCFLYMKGKTSSFTHDVCVWALYSNLICLSLPNIVGFGGSHNPALLARSALLLSGHALGHPTFKLFGFVTVFAMLNEFMFPFGVNSGFDYVDGISSFFQCTTYTIYK